MSDRGCHEGWQSRRRLGLPAGIPLPGSVPVGTIRTMATVPSHSDMDLVLELERELQTPACRADEERVRQLLAHDFVEIGASGRRWDLDSTMAMLSEEATATDGDGIIQVIGLEARALAPDVIQVFWESERAGRRARRTSIWCRRGGAWQQVFHQGTLTP